MGDVFDRHKGSVPQSARVSVLTPLSANTNRGHIRVLNLDNESIRPCYTWMNPITIVHNGQKKVYGHPFISGCKINASGLFEKKTVWNKLLNNKVFAYCHCDCLYVDHCAQVF